MNNATLTLQCPKLATLSIVPSIDKYVITNQVITAVYPTLILSIITINLLSINGIIKTKKKKLNSSQILFLILFLSDVTIGALQLPLGIYIFWNRKRATCFEIQLNQFLIIFTTLMSGSILCVISIDRYINVVSNTYYKRIVTKRLLPVTISLVIVTSSIWATITAPFLNGVDRREVGKRYIALATYCEALMVINIAINITLLTNVKKQRKNSTVRRSISIRLTKTIAIILATFVAAYLPVLVIVNIIAYEAMNSTDIEFLQNMVIILYWVLIPTQLNAVLNSVIYLARNSDIKKYYHNLFNCGKANKRLQNTVTL